MRFQIAHQRILDHYIRHTGLDSAEAIFSFLNPDLKGMADPFAVPDLEPAAERLARAVLDGEKVGLVKVRLYRPFSAEHLLEALPKTTERIAVLDRTKEPGAIAEPLHMDVAHALTEARAAGASPFASDPVVVGGRYGLSSKEFNDAMVKAVFDNLAADSPRSAFTVGIVDDVTHLSLPVDDEYDMETLSEYLMSLKREYPDTDDASVLLEPHIPYDYLIQVMDTVRAVEVPTGVEDEVELYALFSEISVGDAP